MLIVKMGQDNRVLCLHNEDVMVFNVGLLFVSNDNEKIGWVWEGTLAINHPGTVKPITKNSKEYQAFIEGMIEMIVEGERKL